MFMKINAVSSVFPLRNPRDCRIEGKRASSNRKETGIGKEIALLACNLRGREAQVRTIFHGQGASEAKSDGNFSRWPAARQARFASLKLSRRACLAKWRGKAGATSNFTATAICPVAICERYQFPLNSAKIRARCGHLGGLRGSTIRSPAVTERGGALPGLATTSSGA